MMRRAAVSCLGLLLACQPGVPVAVVLRGHGANATGVVVLGAVEQTRRMPDLVEECRSCSGGMNDPFKSTSEYCGEYYQECQCCRSKLQSLKGQMCGQFMGYGSCVDGIKAAIREKDRRCSHQQAVNDYNDNARQRELNEALRDAGYKNGLPGFAAQGANSSASLNATLNATGTLGPFDSECAAYASPSCQDYKSLCAPSYGCNRQLWAVQHDFTMVKNYYEMWANKPCFSR